MAIYVEPVRSDFWQLAREPSGDYIDPLGPKNCMTHTTARAIMRANEGYRPIGISGVWPPTGAAIRGYCIDPATGKPDTKGGINHGQIQRVAAERYATRIGTHYRLPFPDLIDLVEETRGAMLSVWYRRIRDDDDRRGSYTFSENHEIWLNGVDRERRVFTGVVDPLADGRQGLFHGPGDYPFALLQAAAGELNVATSGYRALGYGLCYAATTIPTGGAPVPGPVPTPINYGVTTMNILDGPTKDRILFGVGTPRRMALKAGQLLYRSPSAHAINVLDRLGGDVRAVMTGIPADGWRTVIVSTRNFPDGIRRDVEAYVPRSAGVIS